MAKKLPRSVGVYWEDIDCNLPAEMDSATRSTLKRFFFCGAGAALCITREIAADSATNLALLQTEIDVYFLDKKGRRNG